MASRDSLFNISKSPVAVRRIARSPQRHQEHKGWTWNPLFILCDLRVFVVKLQAPDRSLRTLNVTHHGAFVHTVALNSLRTSVRRTSLWVFAPKNPTNMSRCPSRNAG